MSPHTNPTRLSVRMNYIEGALLRILGLVGRRQFEITAVEARRSDCGRMYEIHLDLLSGRCADNLRRQVAKLYDVHHVEIVSVARVGPIAHARAC